MANITLKGNAVTTYGNLPEVGSKAANFSLVKGDLSRVSLDNYKGHRTVLNIFPSLDTGTCAASVRKFNEIAADFENTKVLCISRDTPFAQNRFCGAEGIKNVETLSDFETGNFGKDYGLIITSGPMTGFLSRSVVIIDADGAVAYTQQAPEISVEPNYDEVISALKK
jgi:thioredoxin-dependent peroxiredoxin